MNIVEGRAFAGFSKKLIERLNALNADYQTFDILSDENVRQGLKEFSNWPTYPQVYLDGELVGGLDIVVESLDSGELQLPTKADNINERLKALINKAPIMIFMKGNREEPRCKFSAALMQIMAETGCVRDEGDR